MTAQTSRRAILAGIAASPAAATVPTFATERDPIFAAIENYQNLFRESVRVYTLLDNAEATAKKTHGWRPHALI